jgi:hypothetical protein
MAGRSVPERKPSDQAGTAAGRTAPRRGARRTAPAAPINAKPRLAKRAEPVRPLRARTAGRQHGWEATGTGEFRVEAAYPDVREELIATGRAMTPHASRSTASWSGRWLDHPGELGAYAGCRVARRLLGDLNALTSARMPAALRAVVADSARRTAMLNAELIAPYAGLADRELVIVPTGSLAMVPGATARSPGPVTVVPSASVAGRPQGGLHYLTGSAPDPVLVAGLISTAPTPNRRHRRAVSAASAVARQRATRSDVAADGWRICRPTSPRRHHDERTSCSPGSTWSMAADGYDLQLLQAPPAATCCPRATSGVRARGQTLGMTAALLYLGTQRGRQRLPGAGLDGSNRDAGVPRRRQRRGGRPVRWPAWQSPAHSCASAPAEVATSRGSCRGTLVRRHVLGRRKVSARRSDAPTCKTAALGCGCGQRGGTMTDHASTATDGLCADLVLEGGGVKGLGLVGAVSGLTSTATGSAVALTPPWPTPRPDLPRRSCDLRADDLRRNAQRQGHRLRPATRPARDCTNAPGRGGGFPPVGTAAYLATYRPTEQPTVTSDSRRWAPVSVT